MFCKGRWIALAAVSALTGCNTANTHIGDDAAFVGEAVKYNAAIQTINPDPVYAEGSALPGDSGVKGAEAVKRYRTDQVKQVETMQTTAGGSGSGSSGSSPH
jgi:hypothetical protein